MKILLSLILVFSFSAALGDEYPMTDYLNGLWESGQKATILEISNDRLATDEYDILGLLLKLEYEIEYLELDGIEITLDRLLSAASQMSTERFLVVMPRVEITINRIRMALQYYTPELIEQDRLKASIINKPLSFREFIEALEEDGWLDDFQIQ